MDYEVYTNSPSNRTNRNSTEDSPDDNPFHVPIVPTSMTLVLATVNVIISVLGLWGNSLVVWICGCKMKRTMTMTWYISLAVSNLLFCAFLPMNVYYTVTKHWPFGSLLCKLTSSLLVFNMYSSVFLLVLISADRCVMVLFPIWSLNNRSPWKAFVIVGAMWVLSALLTLPSIIYRDTKKHGSIIQCHTNYREPSQHSAVAHTRFFCGFVFPFLVIVVCGVGLIMKLKNKTLKSTKPYKVMAALIGSFFVCWFPYNTFVLLELDVKHRSTDAFETGLKVGATLAAANSFISPILYIFIGNDFKTTLKRSLVSKIETALAEDLRQGSPVSLDLRTSSTAQL